MKRRLNALVDELKRLKGEGVTHLSVTEESLQGLRTAVAQNAPVISPGASSTAGPGGVVDLPSSHVRRTDAPKVFARILAEANQNRPGGRPASTPARKEVVPAISGIPVPPVVELPEGDKETRWKALRARVLQCPECNTHIHGETRIVFGVGNIDSDLFFCGEAPGAEEELKGEPFVGPAGRLLDKIIRAMGRSRDEVYIGNIMNWRPEVPGHAGNRPPTLEEMEFCLPYLKAQIEIVDPKVVVALGATAAKGLLGQDSFGALREVRGRWHEFEGRPLMITYHPSYLLRSDSNRTKRLVWEDLLKVMERIDLPVSEKQRSFFL
ncbi:MAG: uracil-DNA glycosylase [Verrucomicrobia bacterium]|nr:MAG: uracil-DNA glycosylase [Verrucomicrobiota bacterium]